VLPLFEELRRQAPQTKGAIEQDDQGFSAISAISPGGRLYFRCQDLALNSAEVVAFLEHLLREVPGRMVIIWDGAPIHRSHVIKEFLANGAEQRLHLERLPAYAPELNPGEGLWQQLKGGRAP
jgi:DDE superfamily endonuclease